MAKPKKKALLPEETIIRNIVLIRKERVILDAHLASLYGVETRVLKQAVRRNLERFPEDFMFELTEAEAGALAGKDPVVIKRRLGGAMPFAFTETGIAMLSSVLKSEAAIEINIAIMRTFVKLRRMAINYDELLKVLEQMKLEYDDKFDHIYAAIEQLLTPVNPPREKIGFKTEL